ncbi:MAG: hypothetical protein AB7S98_16435 [Burkholderiaceae bacterium]
MPVIADSQFEQHPNEFADAEQRCDRAVSACYEQARHRVVVQLACGIRVSFPPRMAEGLAAASERQLSYIEIVDGGQALRWPLIGTSLQVPAMLQGIFGSGSGMAGHPEVVEGACATVKVSVHREKPPEPPQRPLRLS